jgi:hypothetical protein
VDSDVLVQSDTIRRVAEHFSENHELGALFGSYDDNPAAQNFFSQYMNLRHHFIHQTGSSDAVTFWAGCGAIRKDVFLQIGGFNQERYSKPCIEDIEMGNRLKKKGWPILLDRRLQVKHLKKWTFKSLLQADIFSRALPWTRLMLENGEMVNDLNLHNSQKISAVLTGLIIPAVFFSFFVPEILFMIPLLLVTILGLNYRFFRFFLKCNGLLFTTKAFGMHLLYFFYSGATFFLCWAWHKVNPSLIKGNF